MAASIGGAIGGCAVLAICVVIGIICMRRRRRRLGVTQQSGGDPGGTRALPVGHNSSEHGLNPERGVSPGAYANSVSGMCTQDILYG